MSHRPSAEPSNPSGTSHLACRCRSGRSSRPTTWSRRTRSLSNSPAARPRRTPSSRPRSTTLNRGRPRRSRGRP
eukprot:15456617-Alexandrium_andersonii.AAC.1